MQSEDRRGAHVVGRERERDILKTILKEDGPLVVFLHGPAGIGKSALLRSFTTDAESAGAMVVQLDCRSTEPTGRGVVEALGREVGDVGDDAASLASTLNASRDLVVLALDAYEAFRISDSWLRTSFVPLLDDRIRLVIAGREPPIGDWFAARADPKRLLSVLVGPLEQDAALAVLRSAGSSQKEAQAINRIARGHPLALHVAAAALRERPDLPVQESAIPRVVDEFTRAFVERLDAPTRMTLDAASVVRRVTAPLLASMLGDDFSRENLDRLSNLAFVEEGPDGLRLHEAVQESVATRFRSRDPDAYRHYRAAAWRSLQRVVKEVPRSQLWRHTADMLFLIENPAVREAFFPTTAHLYDVESADARDEAAILDIFRRHEPPESAAVAAEWWVTRPSAFRVVRDRSRAVVGVMVVARADEVPAKIASIDPIVAAWRDHLHRHPLPRGHVTLFDRFELSRDDGDAPSDVQAATWLDIKRMYMEMRPHIGRLYSAASDPEPYREALTTLGFAFFPRPIHLGRAYTTAWLDFGPDSVDGWLARLGAVELGVQPHDLLDAESQELTFDDERVSLTPLEFGVLQQLLSHEGRPVSRSTLIERVWGHRYAGGSNVVDVVVRSLRRKLGPKADALQTVRGVGYRFNR